MYDSTYLDAVINSCLKKVEEAETPEAKRMAAIAVSPLLEHRATIARAEAEMYKAKTDANGKLVQVIVGGVFTMLGLGVYRCFVEAGGVDYFADKINGLTVGRLLPPVYK